MNEHQTKSQWQPDEMVTLLIDEVIKKIHNTFMMIDKYPENSERFEFNAVKFERDVKSGKLKII